MSVLYGCTSGCSLFWCPNTTRIHSDSTHAAHASGLITHTCTTSMHTQAEVAKGRTGIMGVLPPHSSGKRPASLSSCFTLSGLAPSLSICTHQGNGCHLICRPMWAHVCASLQAEAMQASLPWHVSTWNLTCHITCNLSQLHTGVFSCRQCLLCQ